MTSITILLMRGFRGESSLKASATRRNARRGTEEHVQGGQKPDAIGTLKLGDIELLVVEVSKVDESRFSSKAVNDDIKIMEGMKDMLDALLLGKLNGITAEEMVKVYTIGVQVIGKVFFNFKMLLLVKSYRFKLCCITIGHDVIIRVMNLAHDQVYRLQEVHKFSVPSTKDNFPYLKQAVSGFLKLKVCNSIRSL